MRFLLLAVTGLLFISGPFFSMDYPRYYLFVFDSDNVTNSEVIDVFTNSVISQFRKNQFYVADIDESIGQQTLPDYLLTVRLTLYQDSYRAVSKWEDIENKGQSWKEEIYTEDLWGVSGIRDCGIETVDRLLKRQNNVRLRPYREKTDYKKKYGHAGPNQPTGFPSTLTRVSAISASIQYPYGYQYGLPFGMGFDFLEGFTCVFIPGTPLGIGVGTKIISLRGDTAWSVLPIKIYLPLYVFPDSYDYNRRDFYLTAEAGFFIWSASYLDISFEAVFNGLSFKIGWFYLPPYQDETYSRAEYSTIYGGVSLYFGAYKSGWF